MGPGGLGRRRANLEWMCLRDGAFYASLWLERDAGSLRSTTGWLCVVRSIDWGSGSVLLYIRGRRCRRWFGCWNWSSSSGLRSILQFVFGSGIAGCWGLEVLGYNMKVVSWFVSQGSQGCTFQFGVKSRRPYIIITMLYLSFFSFFYLDSTFPWEIFRSW